MKPVLQEKKLHHRLWIIYLFIFIICIVGIGMAVYMQYYQEENMGAIFGVTDEESENQDEYNELVSEFSSIFTNEIDILQTETIEVEKINDEYDIIVTAYTYQVEEENYTLDVSIPYINIKDDITIAYNAETKEEFKSRAEEIISEGSSEEIVYNVRYRAYIQNNIISLIIEAEIKEGSKSQKISIKTYNYNFVEQKEVSLEELLEIKGVSLDDASNKIIEEIEEVQNQNDALAEQGYVLYQRDITSDMYEIENTENYFLGQDGMIYVIYAYGNTDYTSEMDIIIFQ